jgi:hypothetical protein
LSLLITASFSATSVSRGFAGIAAPNGVKSPESPSHEGQIAADRPENSAQAMENLGLDGAADFEPQNLASQGPPDDKNSSKNEVLSKFIETSQHDMKTPFQTSASSNEKSVEATAENSPNVESSAIPAKVLRCQKLQNLSKSCRFPLSLQIPQKLRKRRPSLLLLLM